MTPDDRLCIHRYADRTEIQQQLLMDLGLTPRQHCLLWALGFFGWTTAEAHDHIEEIRRHMRASVKVVRRLLAELEERGIRVER